MISFPARCATVTSAYLAAIVLVHLAPAQHALSPARSLLIRDVLTPGATEDRVDVLVEDGVIAAVAPDLDVPPGARIITAEGALTETYHPGAYSLDGLEEASRDDLFRAFPFLRGDVNAYGPLARKTIRARAARVLAA